MAGNKEESQEESPPAEKTTPVPSVLITQPNGSDM